jgi:glycosyltransferase involved in cell wall biosynthesis
VSIVIEELTVLVITLNEEANIERTLQSVAFAGHVLVVDSFSTDTTLEIAGRFKNTEIVQHEFKSFADQCNFGLNQVETEWVLSIDADYRFPPEAAQVIEEAMKSGKSLFEAGFEYCILGKPVHGGILPPRTVLFRMGAAEYVNDGHGHRLNTAELPERLDFKIKHDDRKPLSVWLSSQIVYAKQETAKIGSANIGSLGFNDKLRKLLFLAPPAVFLLVYVFRGGFRSGWRGLFYAMQRFTAELLLSLFLIERIIRRRQT